MVCGDHRAVRWGDVKPRLKLVDGQPIPVPQSRADKLANAIGWLRSRNRYVLDKGAVKPSWGVPGTPKALSK